MSSADWTWCRKAELSHPLPLLVTRTRLTSGRLRPRGRPRTYPRPMAVERVRGIGELIREGERSFSFEFFPPKDEAGEEQLWRAISALEPARPTFVSVTYGAGGSTRDSTVRLTGRIVRETSMTPMAHLTCVGHTRAELEVILDTYREAGVRHVMALRGDPSEGPRAPWTATPGGLNYATELVELVKERGDFTV